MIKLAKQNGVIALSKDQKKQNKSKLLRDFFKFCVNALLWYKIQDSNRACEPQDGLHALFAS